MIPWYFPVDKGPLATTAFSIATFGFVFCGCPGPNTLITDGKPLFGGGFLRKTDGPAIISDLNLFWDVGGKPLRFGTETLEDWQSRGLDRHSIVADPLFRDLTGFDFAPEPASPVWELGFQPIDTSDIGPRQAPS